MRNGVLPNKKSKQANGLKAKVEASSGNVFAGLEVPDAEETLAKAGLVERICDIIVERKLTQEQAAALLGIERFSTSEKLLGIRSFRQCGLLPMNERKGKPMQTTQSATTEAAILSRLVKPDRPAFRPEVAEAILRLELDPKDRDRVHELAVKNQEDKLTEAEKEELEGYRRIGYFVDLMRSKACISLKKHEP